MTFNKMFAATTCLAIMLCASAPRLAAGSILPPESETSVTQIAGDAKPRQFPPGKPQQKTLELPTAAYSGQTPTATGGPDYYGYTWNDAAAFGWVDATAGLNLNLRGDDAMTGPVNIGFNFPYYENTYSSLYVSTNGLVSFGPNATQYVNREMPSPLFPNNFIAAFWDDLAVGGSYNHGAIYALNGGSAPNRFLAVQWNQVTRLSTSPPTTLTFEILLHEGGNITVQYLSMTGELRSATVGIEDGFGEDGLQWLFNAVGVANNKAVRFTRPTAPTARVRATPRTQGRFVRSIAGLSSDMPFTVTNTGNAGVDTIDLIVTSNPVNGLSDWDVRLYNALSVTPLTDTNGNGSVDTGPMAAGEARQFFARVKTPSGAAAGNYVKLSLKARSSLNPAREWTIGMQAAVPVQFAQAYQDFDTYWDSLYLAKPLAQTNLTLDHVSSSETGIAEYQSGEFLYVQQASRYVTPTVYVIENEYFNVNHIGQITRAPSKLADLSSATHNSYDDPPAITVLPNGEMALVWMRAIYSDTTNGTAYNYNVYFAKLSPTGDIVIAPTNLTNNSAFGRSNDQNVPFFYDPHIAATDDVRLAVSWTRQMRQNSLSKSEVQAMVLNSSGGIVKPAAVVSANGEYVRDSWVTRLPNNQWMLVYAANGVHYATFTSSGIAQKSDTQISWSAFNVRAAALSDGKVIIAAIEESNGEGHMAFIPLSATNYVAVGSPVVLNTPTGSISADGASLLARSNGRAVITWTDPLERFRIYYALVDGNAAVVTPPMVMLEASPTYGLWISRNGQGLASYTLPPITPRMYLPMLAR